MGNMGVTRFMRNSNQFIQANNLQDMETKGAEFTWSNGRPKPSQCKLDRFLICDDMIQVWENLGVLAIA